VYDAVEARGLGEVAQRLGSDLARPETPNALVAVSAKTASSAGIARASSTKTRVPARYRAVEALRVDLRE
jgi:hypothetical protein